MKYRTINTLVILNLLALTALLLRPSFTRLSRAASRGPTVSNRWITLEI